MKIRVFIMIMSVLSAFLAWPYYHVWELDRALSQNDRSRLEQLIDLPAIRVNLKRRLNKNLDHLSDSIFQVSNTFILWLQEGIRLLGSDAIDHLVTLDWVQKQLLRAPGTQSQRLLDRIRFAFFERPDRFLVRLNESDQDPVYLRWSLNYTGWRMTALYF